MFSFPDSSPHYLSRWPALGGVLLAILVLAGNGNASAQDLRVQETSSTAWLDLRPAAPGAAPQTTPTWIESFEFIPAKAAADDSLSPTAQPAQTAPSSKPSDSSVTSRQSIFRIRLHRPAAAVDHLQARIFFEDRAGEGRPQLSVWNELGTELMRSEPLGQGLGLDSSETLMVPMAGVDYLEISVPGDGLQVRGVFLTWLEKSRVLQPADFPTGEAVREPFRIQSANRTHRQDRYLYGVVTARLQGSKPTVLKSSESPAATYEFQLERQPLVAVVTYEILGATLANAPTVIANQRPLGASEVYLPDLADPGYRGETREGDSQMGFHYTGWVQAQKVIPGDALAAGLNDLSVALSNDIGTVAIRSVQIQLKYNWEKLDYILSPTPTPAPAPAFHDSY